MGIGSVAGAGAAWVWQGMPKEMLSEVTMDSMKRFLGHNGNSSWSNSRSENERHKVRIFGGNRFDQGSIPAPEWEEFGSFYFFLPRSVKCISHSFVHSNSCARDFPSVL